MKNLIKINTSSLLGISLGLGYLTSYRFIGPIGASEILVFLSIYFLLKKNGRTIFKIPRSIEGYIKIYLLTSTLLILPLITAVVFFLGDSIRISQPVYIISFSGGVLLCFLVLDGVRQGNFDIKNLTLWFALTFITTNLASIYILNIGMDGVRYTGGAKNPNQLLFYASTISLLLIIHYKRIALLAIPIIIFIMLKTKSDAYVLSLALSAFVFLYLNLTFFLAKTSIALKITAHSLILLTILTTSLLLYSEVILDIWLNADEGNTRQYLMANGLVASLQSPFFGWGAGSFSGFTAPFQGLEAHSTFLDFSMSFGVFFPLIIYAIFFAGLLKSIKENNYLISAFIIGFIISGLFHFSGRHFAFWIEVAVFMVYLFPKHTISSKEKTTRCAASPVY